MGLSDCVDCWDTPCTCDIDYSDLSEKRRLEIARAALPPGWEAVKKATSEDQQLGGDHARAKVLRYILTECEWGGTEIDRYGEAAGECCPLCLGEKPVHEKGCELDITLKDLLRAQP